MTQRVAVILVNYNSVSLTRDCVNSLALSRDVELHIVIVDNSLEKDPELQALTGQQANTTLINTIDNVGFGRANNLGIEYALQHVNPDYLFLLNNDTLVQPDTIAILIACFGHNPAIGISTCRITYEHEREKIWYGGGTINYITGWPKITDLNENRAMHGSDQSRFVEFVSGCAMLFSAKSMRDLKGFDPDFFMYVEDLELSIRALESGYKLYYSADTTIYHRVHGSSDSGNGHFGLHPKNPNLAFQFYHKKKNQWITFRKHLSGFRFFVFNFVYHVSIRLKYYRLYVKSPYKKELTQAFNNVMIEIRRYREK